MQVNEIPPPDEIKKKKRRKKKQTEEGDSVVDEVVDGCVFDGCYFISWMPWDIDGCLPDFDGGCIPDFDGGCFDIGDGCSFDGCSMLSLFFLPFRLMVILGLMIYGDWDFKNWTMKNRG